MEQPENKLITPEVYLKMEKTSEYKSEYWHGEIFAMTGASHNHNLIMMNTASSLHNDLKNTDCFVYAGDMKIQVDKAKHYTYPDVSIVCKDIEFADGRNDTIANPMAIFEILSSSTKDYDRGTKFTSYRNIKSLKDYILIDQYSCHVEYFSKIESGKWILSEFKNFEDSLTLSSLEITLSLKTIYDRVVFNPENN